MRAKRKVVVVTGASAGVGRAAARAFAAAGADLGLVARGEDGLGGARTEVEALGGRALALPVDVADADAVEAAADRVERELGPIDVWVNNAMVTVMSRVRDMSAEDFRRVTEVDYLGTVHGTLAALRRMLPRDRGTIVQVGSALAYRAIPLQSAYCGAKFAVRGFTDSLRTELLHEGSKVRLTMVQLPALNTPQFSWSKVIGFDRHPQPVPPIFQPEVAAEAIVFAAGARRREVWVGGFASLSIVGNKIAPWLADRYLARTGFDSQFIDQPLQPDRRHNLDHPVPGDHGAHGRFDDRADPTSLALEASKHRRWLAAGAAALGLAMLTGACWLRRK
ncbi:MAG TPA: SDR family oxidoreductase [Thermoanaerobaculia bacterium]|nr:SDR family oxidoreductase [Thermoanaerobaculia bacterium]